MNIQGFQKLTLLDFPGKVACTVFTGGCNLRCPFCHNASLVLTPREGADQTEAALAYLESRKGILEGVCITGGEPLLQPDLADLMKRIRQMGYAVKLDTNGSDPAALENILAQGLCDYVAMDVKSSPSGYAKATGADLPMERYLASIALLRDSGVMHEFRTTLVKGIHTLSDMDGIGRILQGEKRYFLQTFVDSGNLIGSGYEAFSPEETVEFLNHIRIYIPEAHLRGQEEGE